MTERFSVVYHVRSDAASIEARAAAIAVEQSVEMPLAGIDEPAVLSDIVGAVEAIDDIGGDTFSVRIGLALATAGDDPGQFLNMLFGNTSLHDDVVLRDVAIPERFRFGPGGVPLLRQRLGVPRRAFTGSALKPQGLSPERLSGLAERFAAGGLDFIKDDHGLADQAYSPFAVRVPLIAAAVGRGTHYMPSLTGDLDRLRAQARIAVECGLDCAMVAPMIAGFPAVWALTRAFPQMTFFAHPSMGGAARIAPELLIGKLFPALGCGAVIFPTYGGRFGYSPATCREIVTNARPALAVPAGGIVLNRVPELLDFYGPDTMLLIGGSLLLARDRITEETPPSPKPSRNMSIMIMDSEHIRPVHDDFRWDGVAHQPYKQDGEAPFKDISRQVLFHDDALACELRYFEMDTKGFSSLERHEHAHAVMILRGHGQCMVGDEVRDVKQFDLVTIPAWTWHQFRANAGESFGFLCMVNATRDRPVLPTADDLARMRTNPAVAAFLDT